MDLSIIIPVYNVEKFLPKCLNSVVVNEWSGITYEIIVVDDASPDGSLRIAKEFSIKYPQIKIISQENRGLGGARNTGVRKAGGSYVFFLDSDDYLLPGVMNRLLLDVKGEQLDIVEFGAIRVDENYKKIGESFIKKNSSNVLSGTAYIAKYDFDNSACNKLYRRLFLLENNLNFLEKTYVEDAPFNAEVFVKAKKVKALDEVPVAFLQNRNSITRQKRTGTQLIKFVEDSIKVTHYIHTIALSGLPTLTEEVLKKRVAVFTSGTLLMILRSDLPQSDKKTYIAHLQDKDLYPLNYRSKILARDFFISITNNRLILSFLLRFL